MKSSVVLLTVLTSAAQACYFTVHSSTVGDFSAQHSEPKGMPFYSSIKQRTDGREN